LVLGHHWGTASPAQRDEYLKLFRGYVLAGISRRLGAAKGIEKVDVTGSQRATDDDWMVATQITLGTGAPPSHVEWRVRRTGDGYRIVDVVAEGVSLVLTKRNEFGAIVANSGFDGLLRQLREWRDHPGGRGSEA
jgi:phospholipid transport system substrate-binding protein